MFKPKLQTKQTTSSKTIKIRRVTVALLCLLSAGFVWAQQSNSASLNQFSQSILDLLNLQASKQLFVDPADAERAILLSEGNAFLKASEGGGFNRIQSPFEELTNSQFYFDVNENSSLYAQSAQGELAFSPDLGQRWLKVKLPQNMDPGLANPFAILNTGEARILLGGADGLYAGSLVSSEDGQSVDVDWALAHPCDRVDAISVSVAQESIAVGLSTGKVLVSQDVESLISGSWIEFTPRAAPVRELSFSPFDSEQIIASYASLREAPSDHLIYYTNNSGRTWLEGDGVSGFELPNLPVLLVIFQEDSIYVLNSNGLFSTTQFNGWFPVDPASLEDVFSAAGFSQSSAGTQSSNFSAASAKTVKCTYTVTPVSSKIGAGGGALRFAVNANSSTCAWTTTRPSRSSPISIASGSSGRGDGAVVLNVAANSTTRSRKLSATIAGKRISIEQAASTASCSPRISSGTDRLSGMVPAGGKSFNLSISAATGCSWTFKITQERVSISPLSGSGNKSVRLTIGVNPTSAERTVLVEFGTQTISIKQAGRQQGDQDIIVGPPVVLCEIEADNLQFDSTGGSGIITVTKTQACGTIRIKSSASWLVPSPATVTKNGTSTVTFRVPSTTSARSATITATPDSGQLASGSMTINQAAPGDQLPDCRSLNAAVDTASFNAAGGTARVTIVATGTCATSTIRVDQGWVRVIGASATGATIQVTANSSSIIRRATLTITNPGVAAPISIPLEQSPSDVAPPAACQISLSQTSFQFGPSDRSASLQVIANRTDCPWTVSAFATTSLPRDWAKISPASGTGSRTVTITVAPPSLQSRQGEFQIAGVPVTIRQQNSSNPTISCQCVGPACGTNMQFGINASSFAAAGGSATITVGAPTSCEWTLSNTAPDWLVFIDPPRGTGNGSIRIQIRPNATGGSRSATVTSPQATGDNLGRLPRINITQAK